MEQSCVLEITRRRMNIVVEAERCVHKDLGLQVSRNTVNCVLNNYDLSAQVKLKKPHLLGKNIMDHLGFARVHQDWIVDDCSWVILLDDSKINHFCLSMMPWCWTHDSKLSL